MKQFFQAILLGSFLVAGGVHADEDTPLEEKMEEVSDNLKGLRKATKDKDFATCLELVRDAQSKLLECFAYTPSLIEKMPEGKEKAMATANYKKTLAASYRTLCDLELAYISEDLDKIDDANDAVKKSRKTGHKEFIEED